MKLRIYTITNGGEGLVDVYKEFPIEELYGGSLPVPINLFDREVVLEIAIEDEPKDDRIARATERFLRWRLPDDFSPDGGVSFKKIEHPTADLHPVGTNLLTYQQAEEMIEYILGDEDE